MSIHKFIVPVLRRNEHGNWCLCFQSVPLPDYCCAVKHTHTHTTSTDNARTVRTREKFPAVLFICFFVFVNQMSHLALNSCSINKFYWMVSSLILSRMRALIMCVWECGEWICSRNINDGRRIVNSVRLQLRYQLSGHTSYIRHIAQRTTIPCLCFMFWWRCLWFCGGWWWWPRCVCFLHVMREWNIQNQHDELRIDWLLFPNNAHFSFDICVVLVLLGQTKLMFGILIYSIYFVSRMAGCSAAHVFFSSVCIFCFCSVSPSASFMCTP